MNLVKEHNGVKIFVSVEGEFYCDVITNSDDYKNKTFVSEKLQSIEKVIDNFQGQEIYGNKYYDINVYSATLKLLQVIKKIGNRLFFDDGTDSANWSRKNLYPESVDKKQEFKDLELLFEQLKKNQKEINKLLETQRQLRLDAEKKLNYLSKVDVS